MSQVSVKLSSEIYARVKAYRDTLPYDPTITNVLNGLLGKALTELEPKKEDPPNAKPKRTTRTRKPSSVLTELEPKKEDPPNAKPKRTTRTRKPSSVLTELEPKKEDPPNAKSKRTTRTRKPSD